MPASTAKLVTATNALAAFGSSHRFTTTVRRGYQADQVFLVGSGDPDLSSGQLAVLARATATKMKAARQTRVRVYADDYLFAAPTLATGWKSSYIPADTTWLRALVVDRHDVTDTSIDAANVFAGKLRANGITVTRIGRGRAGSGPVLASSAGVTLGSTISHMMLTSDNEHAEALHRLVGIRSGYGNTWSAARAAQQKGLAAQGLSATALYDGSGLSRSDRLTGVQLARVVANAFEPANSTRLALLRSNAGLPVVGPDGDAAGQLRPVHDGRLEVRRREGPCQDRVARGRRQPGGLDRRQGRAGEDVRVRRQRPVGHAGPAAERRHARGDRERLLLTAAVRPAPAGGQAPDEVRHRDQAACLVVPDRSATWLHEPLAASARAASPRHCPTWAFIVSSSAKASWLPRSASAVRACRASSPSSEADSCSRSVC